MRKLIAVLSLVRVFSDYSYDYDHKWFLTLNEYFQEIIMDTWKCVENVSNSADQLVILQC